MAFSSGLLSEDYRTLPGEPTCLIAVPGQNMFLLCKDYCRINLKSVNRRNSTDIQLIRDFPGFENDKIIFMGKIEGSAGLSHPPCQGPGSLAAADSRAPPGAPVLKPAHRAPPQADPPDVRSWPARQCQAHRSSHESRNSRGAATAIVGVIRRFRCDFLRWRVARGTELDLDEIHWGLFPPIVMAHH